MERTTTLSTIKFRADDRLLQPGGVYNLTLRLRNPNDTWLSASVFWSDGSEKDIMTGVSTGTKFKISACCHIPGTGDYTWGGRLTF